MRSAFMKMTISTGILSVVLAVLLIGCTSESTSTTEFNVTTTTDEGTKEYNYKSENNNGDVTTSSTVTETPAEEDDDTISYEVKDGELIVEAPSRDTDWWEVIPYEASTTLKDWSVADGIYTGVVGALFTQGTGYVVLGEYDVPDSDPISFTIIQVDIEDSEIVSVGDHVMVDSLDEYFPVFEKGMIASDKDGNDLTLIAFYRDIDDTYIRIYDGEEEAYVPYHAESVALNNSDGSTTDALEIQYGENSLYYFSENGKTYIMDDEDAYEVRELTEDEVDAVCQN